jgi:hypothetical protein
MPSTIPLRSSSVQAKVLDDENSNPSSSLPLGKSPSGQTGFAIPPSRSHKIQLFAKTPLPPWKNSEMQPCQFLVFVISTAICAMLGPSLSMIPFGWGGPGAQRSATPGAVSGRRKGVESGLKHELDELTFRRRWVTNNDIASWTIIPKQDLSPHCFVVSALPETTRRHFETKSLRPKAKGRKLKAERLRWLYAL